MDEKTHAALVALVRAEAFKTDPKLTVEENAINFAVKIFLFAKEGQIPDDKTPIGAR